MTDCGPTNHVPSAGGSRADDGGRWTDIVSPPLSRSRRLRPAGRRACRFRGCALWLRLRYLEHGQSAGRVARAASRRAEPRRGRVGAVCNDEGWSDAGKPRTQDGGVAVIGGASREAGGRGADLIRGIDSHRSTERGDSSPRDLQVKRRRRAEGVATRDEVHRDKGEIVAVCPRTRGRAFGPGSGCCSLAVLAVASCWWEVVESLQCVTNVGGSTFPLKWSVEVLHTRRDEREVDRASACHWIGSLGQQLDEFVRKGPLSDLSINK